MNTKDFTQKFYACVGKDEDIRLSSSSGGAFYSIAKSVISDGGIVFGAKFNDEWEVVHGFCESVSDISDFMGSKYVQSKIGDTYKMVKSYLTDGRKVLFCGTPCQIYGLKSYLGKDFENLLTVDFVCHGVPSPAVWRKYISERSKGRKIEKVNFRDKTEGWRKFSLSIKYSNGDEYRKIQYDDLYMKGFLQNIYLRPSCYECSFKGVERGSDLTLADFWKAQIHMPELYDNKGTSLVIVNTQKGEHLFELIKDDFLIKETDMKTALLTNLSATESVALPAEKRSSFFYDTTNSVIKRIDNVTKVSFTQKVKRKLKKLLAFKGE